MFRFTMVVRVIVLGVVLSSGARAEEARQASTVRLGMAKSMFGDFPEAALEVIMRPLNRILEADAGITTRVVSARDYDHLGEHLVGEKAEIGLFTGVDFAWAKLKHPKLVPLAIAVNERPYLRSVLVVHTAMDAKCAGDLKGKSCALPKGSRQHCRMFMCEACRQCGQDPTKHFGKVLTPASPMNALDDVFEGKADCAVVDELALDYFRWINPPRGGKLRALATSDAFPPAVVAFVPNGMDDTVAKRLRAALLRAGKNPAAEHWFTLLRMTGFEPVPDDFDKTIKDFVKLYPPPQAAQETKKP